MLLPVPPRREPKPSRPPAAAPPSPTPTLSPEVRKQQFVGACIAIAVVLGWNSLLFVTALYGINLTEVSIVFGLITLVVNAPVLPLVLPLALLALLSGGGFSAGSGSDAALMLPDWTGIVITGISSLGWAWIVAQRLDAKHNRRDH